MKPLKKNARILIVKFNAIGDLVMTTPAIRDLRNAYPDAHLTLMVGSWSAPVIRDNPRLDDVLEFDLNVFLRKDWIGLYRLLREVRKRRFDCAVILHALLPVHVFMLLAGIPLRYGMARRGRDMFLTKSVSEEHDPDGYYAVKYQQVAALAGATTGSEVPEMFATVAEETAARDLLITCGVGAGDDFLLVAPGGGRNPRTDAEAKRWPVSHAAALIREALAERPRLRIVLVGSESDRAETGHLLREIPGAVDLTGRVTLVQLYCIARAARAVLCNDSAAMHIGVASGTPVVVVFGPTSMRQLLPKGALRYAWQSDIACSPCYKVGGGHEFEGCPIGNRCVKETREHIIRPLLGEALRTSR